MKDLSQDLRDESVKLHADGATLWLFDVNIGASEILYIAANNENVTWNGRTYYAFPVATQAIPESSDVETPSISVTVANPDGSITDYLRDGSLVGQGVTIHIVHADHLGGSDEFAQYRGEILSAEVVVAESAVVFRIGATTWLQKKLGRRFARTKCWHVYGSDACGYDTTRAGALATCDQGLDTANGCEVHGDDEESVGLVRLHPLRGGFFPGIPAANRG